MHPLGLFGPSIPNVTPCLAVVWLALGAARRPLAGIRCYLAGAGWSLAGGSLSDGLVITAFRLMVQF